MNCKFRGILSTLIFFHLSNCYSSLLLNPELGIKNYFNSVVAKDKHDGVMDFGISYHNYSFSASIDFITGSTKKEKDIFMNFTESDTDYSTNIFFSNSLDLLIGKLFFYKSYLLHLQGGADFSTLKIEGTINKIQPEYKVLPKLKVSLGKRVAKNTYLMFSCHYVHAINKLSAHPTSPYEFRGASSQGIITIGVNYFI